MNIRYDEKGKIFTSVITKDAVPVIIQTLLHRIEGNMYVRQEDRVKDALDRSVRFLAITEAVVFNSQGQQIYETGFMVVNCDQIVWLIPTEDENGQNEERTDG
jgi:hypothetical protein